MIYFVHLAKKTLDTHTAVPCSLAAHKRLKEYEWPSGFWKISNQENPRKGKSEEKMMICKTKTILVQ